MARSRTIARNSLFLTLAHGISKVFSIGLTAIATRVLGPAAYGFYGMGSALIEVARVIASAGLDYLVAREVVSDRGRSSYVASNASALKVILGCITLVAMLGIVVWLDYPRPVLWVVLILGVAIFLENVSDVIDAVFQGHERMQYSTLAFAVSSAAVFATGAVALGSGFGLVGYCGALALGFLVRWVALTWLGARHQMVRLQASLVKRAELRRMGRAGAPLLGATVVALLFHRVDLLMLGKLVAESEVGLYTAAVRIIDVVVLMPRILATAVYPALRRSRDDGDPRATADLLAESSRLSLVICSGVGIAVWVLAPVALRTITDPEFLPATTALRLLSMGIVLQAATHMFARMLFADEREVDFLWIGGISLACNVVLNLVLIPRYGIEGAAASTVLAYCVNAAMYFGFVRRRGIPVGLGTSILGPVAAVAIGVMATRWLAGVWDAVGLIGGWLLALVLLRVVRVSDVARARDLLRRSGPVG